MKTIQLQVELTYDPVLNHGPDPESIKAFVAEVLYADPEGPDGLTLHSKWLDDEVGTIRVLQILGGRRKV